jgi:hypothetical protein
MPHRIGSRNVAAGAADRSDELDLVVQALVRLGYGMRPSSPSGTTSSASAGFMKKKGGSRR